jgi:hypothetical protein
VARCARDCLRREARWVERIRSSLGSESAAKPVYSSAPQCLLLLEPKLLRPMKLSGMSWSGGSTPAVIFGFWLNDCFSDCSPPLFGSQVVQGHLVN